MATSTVSTPTRPGSPARTPPPRLNPPRRRRDLPYVVLGLLLVVVGALAVTTIVARTGGRTPVLVLSRDVPAGQVVTAADLRSEQISTGTGVATVAAGSANAIVGKTATVPLRSGHLLAPDDVGAAEWPPTGQAVLALSLKPGAYPPELTSGTRVAVLTAPPDGQTSTTQNTPVGPGDAPSGTVLDVRTDVSGLGSDVVSLLLPQAAAVQVTAIPGSQIRLAAISAASS